MVRAGVENTAAVAPKAAGGKVCGSNLAGKCLAAAPALAAGRGWTLVTSALSWGRRGLLRHFRAPGRRRAARPSGSSPTGTMSEADGLRQRRPLRPQVVTDDGRAPEAKDGR